VRFSDAIASSTWTAPSLASLSTGVVSLRHGVLEPIEGKRLPRGIPTLAATLRAAGWHTAASTGGAWAGPSTGVEAGFEDFHEDFDDAPASKAIARWAASRPTGRPFFLWLHTYVAHDPYGGKDADREPVREEEVAAGREIAELLAGAEGEALVAPRREFVLARLGSANRRRGIEAVMRPRGMWDAWMRFLPWVNGGWRDDPGGPAMVKDLRAAYDANLRTRVDRRVSETLAALERAVPMERVVTIVTADHGEGFGEHGVLCHGSRATEDLARVPLLARGPGFPAGSTVDEPCGLEDVMPTVLDLAGLRVPSHVDGHSLLGLVDGSARGHPVETVAAPFVSFTGTDPAACRVAVRSREVAWLAQFDVATRLWADEQWFDRVADPREQSPLFALPASGAALRGAIDAAKARVERRYGSGAMLSAALR
jgi:hypothetical protein